MRKEIFILAALGCAGSALAGPPGHQRIEVFPKIHMHTVVLDRSDQEGEGGIAGVCQPIVVAHTDSDFGPGEYIAQGGFVEGEIAATSYEFPPSAFPIKIELAEMLFATSGSTVTTTTEWAVHFWSGLPSEGFPDQSFYSDGDLLPHAVMPPGSTGLQLQFLVDPADPKQIFIEGNPENTVTVGFEIVSHHNQSGNGCLNPPSPQSNAFPTTDVDGLDSISGNWIYVFDCGLFGCPPGWKRFSDLPSICRPSGDWVQRLTVRPFECETLGACCIDGNCTQLDEATCLLENGVFQGPGINCASVSCNFSAPCCFESTGGCVELDAADCTLAGGIPGTIGATCASTVCFPVGACCLPDGSCTDGLSPEACAAVNGIFQGDGSECLSSNCPVPTGAACFPTGFCLLLTEDEAFAAGATWAGAGTTCDDTDSDGTADACQGSTLIGDFNGDGLVNGADLGLFLVNWGGPGETDLNADGVTNGADLGILLVNWTI